MPDAPPRPSTPSSSAPAPRPVLCRRRRPSWALKVLLVDHAEKVAEKIRISGGGRCNFTNRDLDARAPQKHFLGDNPHFCRSALARYTPQDFIALVQKHGILPRKAQGQLFGDRSFRRLSSACCWPNARPAA
jgi:predicted flavoprotein YhiN